MTWNTCRSLLVFAAALGIAAPLALEAPAEAESMTSIKLTLDWKYQGIHAFVFWAQDKGYFAKEGLSVAVDQGEGSAATVTRIASGAYDAGLGDVNAIVTLGGKEPGKQPVMVYMMYNSSPFALITKESGPVRTLKDLEGRTVGYPAGASAGQLFAPLAKLNGIDLGKLKIINMSPTLQEQMMLKGDVDASAVFTVTSYVNLIGQKVDPDKDIRWLYYSKFGVNPYANGLMVSQRLLREHPQAVAGLVRALNRAFIESALSPDAAIALVVKQEPLLNAGLERQRLVYAYKTHFVTAETEKIGVGDVTDERMSATIKLNVDAFNLPRTPSIADVFNRAFLPPVSDRSLHLPM
ncbi:MAG TPA: ABC transporter substrate-binding protein [Xanthobacteraceae bacterium]|jgi:NitT/TauT family transport system substrate-binding protein